MFKKEMTKNLIIGLVLIGFLFHPVLVSAFEPGSFEPGGFGSGSVDVGPFPREVLEHNTKVVMENQRYSLFLVLSRLSLEELQKMLQECLMAAFGEGDFTMSAEMLNSTIDQSFREGMSSFLAEYLTPGSDDYAEAFYRKLRAEMNKGYDEAETTIGGVTTTTVDFCIEDCKNKKIFGPEVNTEAGCREKCKKYTKAISDLLLGALTGELRTLLPDKIKEILNQRLRDVIFKKGNINEFLSAPTSAVINKVSGDLLNKTMADEIPALKETLGRKVTSYMAPSLVKPLEKIDRLLTFSIESFQEKIDEKIERVINSMAQKLKNAIQKPTDATSTAKEWGIEACCNVAYYKYEPWYWNSVKQECVSATRGEIKTNWRTIDAALNKCNSDNVDIDKSIKSLIANWEQSEFCERIRSGFFGDDPPDSCWDNSECKQCQKAETWKEVADIGGWWRTLTSNLFTALLALPQQIMLAMVETAAHTLTEFAEIWVEDELITPFQPYFDKLKEFQEKLHDALNYTVADLLPKQAVNLMTNNAVQILQKICDNTDNMLDTTAGVSNGVCARCAPTEQPGENSGCSKCRDAKSKACNIYSELNKDILAQISETGHLGKEIADALNSTVFELLPADWQATLSKSIAEIFWPEITNIKALIKGTPKQFICGELLNTDFGVKINTSDDTVFKKCGELKTTAGTVGLLPYIDIGSASWTNISDNNQKKYAISCPIIWYVCQNPLSPWTATIGETIVNIISNQCDRIDKKTSNSKCDWRDYASSTASVQPATFMSECAACKTLNSSLAFLLFRFGMEQSYGTSTTSTTATARTCANASSNELRLKCQERGAYQWLYVAFVYLRDSTGIQDFHGGIKQLALSRKFSEPEWDDKRQNTTSSLVQEINYYERYNQSPPNMETAALTFVNWMTQDTPLKEILTSIPLGVIKPSVPGEATLLRPAEYKPAPTHDFLVYTPYEFLKNELCAKVIADFRKDFPTSTIEAIMAGKAAEIAEAGKIPYSVESLRQPTIAQAEQILLSIPEDDQLSIERKAQYLTCYALDRKPAELFGLDQKLIEYVRPEPYKVLFMLIKEKLKESERPTLLNKLLYYLYAWTPVQLACAILQDTSYGYDAEIVSFTCNFLGPATMGDRVKSHLPNRQMICLIADGLINESNDIIASSTSTQVQKDGARKVKVIAQNCFSKTLSREDWADLQFFLRKSPLQIIKEYLTQRLLNNKFVDAPALMYYIAKYTPLGKPYIDTLSRWLHLDEPITGLFLTKGKFDTMVNSAVSSTVTKIQNTFEKILVEYPKAAYQWLLKSLGINMGEGVAADIADQVAGYCWQTTKDKCITTASPKNVYNETTGECCNMGAGLVCEPRCKPRGNNESCKIFEGEASTTIAAKPFCCSGSTSTKSLKEFSDTESQPCDLCRRANSEEVKKNKDWGGIKGCGRNPDPKNPDPNSPSYERFISTTIMANDGYNVETYNLCCRNRELKTYDKQDITYHSCCINVKQCISDKFVNFLEMFSDAMLHGPLLEKLK